MQSYGQTLRVIAHVDMDAFFATASITHHYPKLRGKPVVVGGDKEKRHGIVLAKTHEAKRYGVKTGQAIWEAQKACPILEVIPPDNELYLHMAKKTRKIFGDYTDRIEPFGIDEAWLDLSNPKGFEGAQADISDMQNRFYNELGLTASAGIAGNKVFAKLGSDMKKPNGITVIRPDDVPTKVWPLPVGELLFVGPATTKRLNNIGINTIGDLARMDCDAVRGYLGKNGIGVWINANGLSDSPVSRSGSSEPPKSIGNSTTTPRDLVCNEDVWHTVMVLADSVATRLRKNGYRARTVSIMVRDGVLLSGLGRQTKLRRSTQLTHEIAKAAMALFERHHNWQLTPTIRTMGVCGSDLEPVNGIDQLSFIPDIYKTLQHERLATAIDSIRDRYGYRAILCGTLMADPIGEINPREHMVQFNKGDRI